MQQWQLYGVKSIKMAGLLMEGTRERMTKFWEEHSQEASIEEMMLDSNAEELTKHELPEILSYLPSWNQKDVIELGAGIGRFTGQLAKNAKSVVAVDFMEKFITKNRAINSCHSNIEFHCADVTKLDLPDNAYDIVFSNWLMMYLADAEVQNLIKKELSWLREGGYLFARESCVQQSGDKKRKANPSQYRDPSLYNAMFSMLTIQTEDPNEVHGFELVLSRPVNSYIKLKHNKHQVIWLLQKFRRPRENGNGYKTFQEFLDNQQYSLSGILRYEKVFGRTFVSTGGINTTKAFVSRLGLKPRQMVLDIGCGIGGGDFHMAKEYGVKVTGIDLSSNMIDIAMARAEEFGMSEEDVQFEIADATKREYQPESFDVIYSRDTILHISDKLALFQKFYKWLKVGGKLFISDYCCSAGDNSDHFKKYVKQRGCDLLSLAEYGKVLEKAEFTNVQADDRTDLLVECLESDLNKTEEMRDEFIKEFSPEDYDYIVNGLKDKLGRVDEQRWGVFYAEKH